MAEEIWKDVVGYEGLYRVSSLGNISVNRLGYGKKFIKSNGGNLKLKNKLTTLVKGYLKVCLCKEGKPKNYFVHRLVAIAFLPNPENKGSINHIDGIKTHNYTENLEWCTIQENIAHAVKNGLRGTAIGDQLPHTRLTIQEVTEIKILLGRNYRPIDIFNLNKFNCEYSGIVAIKADKIWKHVII